jgi:hypothetical protein
MEGESESESEEEAQEAQPVDAPPPFVDLQEPEEERGQELAPPYEEPIRPVPARVILEAFHEMLDDRTDYTREELLEVVNSLFAEIFP